MMGVKMKEHKWETDIGATSGGLDGVYCSDCEVKMNADMEEIVSAECSAQVNSPEIRYEFYTTNDAGGYQGRSMRRP